MAWDRGQVRQHLLQGPLADPFDEHLERLIVLTLGDKPLRDSSDRLGDSLRGDGADRQTVGPGVVHPLASQHHLEMRHGVPVDRPTDAVQTDVGDVMLPARVEATARLDPQTLDRLIELSGVTGQIGSQLGRESPGRRDPELAGVGAWAGGDVGQRAGTRFPETSGAQLAIQAREIGFADPAQHDVLLHRGPDRVTDVATGDIRQVSQLSPRQIAKREHHRDDGVSRLALAIDVGPSPGVEPVGQGAAVERVGLPERGLRVRGRALEVRRPPVIGRQLRPLLENQSLELLDAVLRDEELDASAGPIFLFAKAREHARDGLRER